MKKRLLFLITFIFVISTRAQNQGFTTYNQGTQFVSVEVDEFNNRVWSATRYSNGSSIMMLDQNQDTEPTDFSTFEGVTPTGTPLKNYFIRDLAVDSSGNVWVAHYGYGNNNVVGGVEKIKPDLSIKHYYAYDAGGGLQTRKVRSIIVDDNNKVWAAQYYHRLISTPPGADPNTTTVWPGTLAWKSEMDFDFHVLGNTYRCAGQPAELPYPRNSFGEIVVPESAERNFQALSSDDTEVWASHWAYETGDDDCTSTHTNINDRILRYSLDGAYLGELFPNTDGTVVNICRNNEKGTWITTHLFDGFSVYKDGNWITISSADFPNVIPPNTGFNANAMWKDSEGKVYMGTTNGLIVYNGVGEVDDQGSYKLYTNYDFGADPASDNYDSYVYDDTMVSRNIFGGSTDPRDSRINWIATENGIMKMARREGIILMHRKDYTITQNEDRENIEYLAELPNIELSEDKIPMLAADGSNATIFRIYTTEPADYYGSTPLYKPQISIDGEVAADPENTVDINKFGKFTRRPLTDYTMYGIQGTDSEVLNQLKYVEYIYKHPNHIEDIDYEIDEIYELVSFKIIDQNEDDIFNRQLKIAIPPVLLGHGVWSSIHSLAAMESFLLNGMKYPKYAVSKFWRTIDESDKQNPENSFQEDSKIIPGEINKLKENSRKNKFSVGKVNVIVHSRGGLYTRGYIEEINTAYPYKQDINSLITVDTPHFGSQGGNVALDWREIGSAITISNTFVASIEDETIIPIAAILIGNNFTIGGLASLGSVPMKDNPRYGWGGENWGARNLIVENDDISGITSHNEDPGFIRALNMPYFLNKLNGTPIHTISSSCNPCIANPLLCLDPSGLQEITTNKVMALLMIKELVHDFLNVDNGINSVTDALFNGEENDFIVPLTSMTAGLSGNYNTHFAGGAGNLNLDHTGMFSAGIMNHPSVHSEIKHLLMSNVNDDSSNGLFTKNGITNNPRTYNFLATVLDPVRQHHTEDTFESKILINRDPTIFDNRIEGDVLNYKIYQEDIDRIMVTYEGENDSDNFSYEIKKDNLSFENYFTYPIPEGYSGLLTITAYGFKNGVVGVAKSTVTLNVGIPADVTLQSIHFTIEEPIILEQDNYNYTIKGMYSDGIERIINNEDITFTIEEENIISQVDANAVKGASIGESLLKAEFNGFEDTVRVKVRSNPSLQQTILTNLYAVPNESNTEIAVNWVTLHEYENATFVLETSYNTPDNFTEIDSQAGNGTLDTPADFTYTDTSFGSHTTIYYRIKMIDTSGNETYSSIIEVNLSTASIGNNNLNNVDLELYPNPTNTNEVTLKLNSTLIDKNAKLEMYNLQGKRLSVQLLNVVEGTNTFKLKIRQGLSDGIYLIKVSTAGYIKTLKLIVE